MNVKVNVMLRAGALYFAIFISFIVALLLGSIILLTFHNNRYIENQSKRDQAESNASSGIILALFDSSLLSDGCSQTRNIFDTEDSTDQIKITKSYWGVFQIIRSSANWKNFEINKIALVGTDISENEHIALYLTDKERYLSVSGNTKITGICYLPKLGIRMAYVEGENFNGDKAINGEIRISDNHLPEISNIVLSKNFIYTKGQFPKTDSLIKIDDFSPNDSIQCSFKNNTVTFYSPRSIILDHIFLRGNIHIVSAKAIYVSANAICDNIILHAPSIYFDSGFEGSLQAFASDTLMTGDFCQFKFPSCLSIINENTNGIYMSIGQSSNVTGCILLNQTNKGMNEPYLKIGKQTIIHGQIYCQGKVELNGKVEGSVYCQSFILRTNSGLYENLLYNTIINRVALSKYYCAPFLTSTEHAKIIEWLN